MRLVIACLLIHGLDLHWGFYPAALVVWWISMKVRDRIDINPGKPGTCLDKMTTEVITEVRGEDGPSFKEAPRKSSPTDYHF